jgi:phospholipid N-methyltransferase
MRKYLSDYRLFLREFIQSFHTTGAILPSGRKLASALVRYVNNPDRPRRILEVGPGTGAVTRRLVAAMGADDCLDLVELNEHFVQRLKDLFASDPAFQAVADRTNIFHCSVEDLPQDRKYDLVISGLPLNNFSAELVERIVKVLTGVLKPGGTLSFFEYIAVRSARTLISGRKDRTRLRGISRVLGELFKNEIRRDWVWPNVPPAWVHHIRV